MPKKPNDIAQARALLKKARRAVAFTGAGISAESGIRTFRGDGGLWNEVDIETYATPWGVEKLLKTEPQSYCKYLNMRAKIIYGAMPNPAHYALAELEQRGTLAGIVTQNIDNLHDAAGSKNIFKLHGDLKNWRCLSCGSRWQQDSDDLRRRIEAAQAVTSRDAFLALLPRCARCDGYLRPSVVLFGESLPEDQVSGAIELLGQCDCLLVIGTSGVVEPAAGFARQTSRRGVPTIEINLEPSDLSQAASLSLFGKAGEILPLLIAPN